MYDFGLGHQAGFFSSHTVNLWTTIPVTAGPRWLHAFRYRCLYQAQVYDTKGTILKCLIASLVGTLAVWSQTPKVAPRSMLNCYKITDA